MKLWKALPLYLLYGCSSPETPEVIAFPQLYEAVITSSDFQKPLGLVQKETPVETLPAYAMKSLTNYTSNSYPETIFSIDDYTSLGSITVKTFAYFRPASSDLCHQPCSEFHHATVAIFDKPGMISDGIYYLKTVWATTVMPALSSYGISTMNIPDLILNNIPIGSKIIGLRVFSARLDATASVMINDPYQYILETTTSR